MLAALSMYDLPEIRPAVEDWWQGLARAFHHSGLEDVPTRLTWDRSDESLWDEPSLLFGQTCGYPLTHRFRGRLQLIATPCYAADGCHGPDYCSFLMVRADDPVARLEDLRGRRVAINNKDSHSGCNVLRHMVGPMSGPQRFFRRVVVTGSHLASLKTVARGEADLAAIDCVLHALLAAHRPSSLAGVRVLTRSPAAPGLPYVTAATTPAETRRRLRAGLFAALVEPSLAACRDVLLITDAEILPLTAYNAIRRRRARTRLEAH